MLAHLLLHNLAVSTGFDNFSLVSNDDIVAPSVGARIENDTKVADGLLTRTFVREKRQRPRRDCNCGSVASPVAALQALDDDIYCLGLRINRCGTVWKLTMRFEPHSEDRS